MTPRELLCLGVGLVVGGLLGVLVRELYADRNTCVCSTCRHARWYLVEEGKLPDERQALSQEYARKFPLCTCIGMEPRCPDCLSRINLLGPY